MRPKVSLYVDPYSGYEVIEIEPEPRKKPRVLVGVAYDPLSTARPVPWSSACQHCQNGRQQDLSIHTKREIKLLLSRVDVGSTRRYTVPTNVSSLSLLYWKERGRQRAKIWGEAGLLDVTLRDGEKPTYEGDRRSFQSPVLRRCLKFLSSSRKPSREHVVACIGSLATEQRTRKKTRGGRILPCKSVDWQHILEALT